MTKTTDQLTQRLRTVLAQEKAASKKPKPRAPAPENGPGGAQRLSITVYPPDLRRLDEIKHVMLAEGVRNLSDSEALRLAVRTSATNAELLGRVYKAMLLEDLRRV